MIEFKNARIVYSNGTVGLNNVNLKIDKGEFIAIIGLSGAGKSTLLRSINRLIDLTEGEIFIDNKSITQAKPKELRHMRRNIGMIFQHFNLVRRNTVQRNVLSGRLGYYSNWESLIGKFSKEDYQKVEQALDQVRLGDKLKTRSGDLSGGQQQRVSIARTLVQEADIILADEPVASLDPITSKSVMDDIRTINRDLNKTVLVNIHSIDLAREYADRVIGMRSGEIGFDGPTEEATDQRLGEIYGQDIFSNQDKKGA